MGYQRRVHGDSSLESQVELTETTWTRPPTMKTVNCNYDVSLEEFGEKVKMVVKGQSVTVSGPRGTLHRDFSHLKVELKKTGAQSLRITKWWTTRYSPPRLQPLEGRTQEDRCPKPPNHQVVGNHETKGCSSNRQQPYQEHGRRCHQWLPIQDANRLRAFPNQHDCQGRGHQSRDPKLLGREDQPRGRYVERCQVQRQPKTEG